MRRKINNIISVICSMFRMLFYKIFRGSSFKTNLIQRISPNVVLEVNRGSKVKFGKKIRIHSGCKVKVRKNAKLIIEDNVKINYYCIIVCHNEIEIGQGTEFGPSVYLYDHDHDYRKGLSADSDGENYKSSKIRIGKNCWIGANTVILRGTELGDNCIVGAGSVLKGKYADNSVVVQKRESVVNMHKADEVTQ